MYSLFQDFWFALKSLRRRSGVTALVLTAFALGIGVNSAVFSVVNAVLLRALPFRDAKRIVVLQARTPTGDYLSPSYADYLDWRNQSRSFESIAAYHHVPFIMTGIDTPERLRGCLASASYFSLLGVQLQAGRDFLQEDDRLGAGRVAIISYELWERNFGGDIKALGRSLILDNRSYLIIGIAPPSQTVQGIDVWIPIGLFADESMLKRDNRHFGVIARLAPHVTESQAAIEMKAIGQRLAASFPVTNAGFGVRLTNMFELVVGQTKTSLSLLLVASLIMLVLTCFHISTTSVAGLMDRDKEMGIRLALGARRTTLLRELLIGNGLLVSAGTILGLYVAHTGIMLVINTYGDLLPRFKETSIDLNVIAFSVCISVLAGLFSILLPGLHVARLGVTSVLRQEAPILTVSRFRITGHSALITVELALAFALCLISALLAKSFYQVRKVDLGFDASKLFSFQVSLPRSHYPDAARITQFYIDLNSQLKRLPGVRSVSAASFLPLLGTYAAVPVEWEGAPQLSQENRPFCDSVSVLPGYFDTMKIPILAGRDFSNRDRSGALEVAIVDEVFAEKAWPRSSAIGRRIRLLEPGLATPSWVTVVGVVRQVKQYGPEDPVPRVQVYLPLLQKPVPEMAVVAQFSGDKGTMMKMAGRLVQKIDRDLPVYDPESIEELYLNSLGNRKVATGILGGFAGVAVLLGALGIFGVMSHAVQRRRRELAIRIALGSTLREVIILLVRPGLLCTCLGLLVGLILVSLFKTVLSSYVYGISAFDMKTYLIVVIAFAAVALIATLAPVRKLLNWRFENILRE